MRADRAVRRALVVTMVLVLAGFVMAEITGLEAAVQPQDEFIPLDSVPPEDQLPAAPLLVAAYALLWIAVVGYLWTIWRRMATVERELSDLSRRTGES